MFLEVLSGVFLCLTCHKHPLFLRPDQQNIGTPVFCVMPKSWLLFLFLLSQLTSREKAAMHYNQKLKEKFQHHPQVKRIARHRHLPRDIFKQKRELREMKEARRRK